MKLSKKCSNKEHAVDPMCSAGPLFSFSPSANARRSAGLLPCGASGERRQVSSARRKPRRARREEAVRNARGGERCPPLRACRRRRRQSRRSRRRSCGRAAAPSSADGGAVFPSGSSGRSAFGMHPAVDVSACESFSSDGCPCSPLLSASNPAFTGWLVHAARSSTAHCFDGGLAAPPAVQGSVAVCEAAFVDDVDELGLTGWSVSSERTTSLAVEMHPHGAAGILVAAKNLRLDHFS